MIPASSWVWIVAAVGAVIACYSDVMLALFVFAELASGEWIKLVERESLLALDGQI